MDCIRIFHSLPPLLLFPMLCATAHRQVPVTCCNPRHNPFSCSSPVTTCIPVQPGSMCVCVSADARHEGRKRLREDGEEARNQNGTSGESGEWKSGLVYLSPVMHRITFTSRFFPNPLCLLPFLLSAVSTVRTVTPLVPLLPYFLFCSCLFPSL